MWTLKSLKAINIISFKNVEFTFRNGKAVIITGSNLDDASQKINGSGKSSLIESIAIAFSGTSIRAVKTKELINNDATDGTVELKLFNSQLNHELIIWRKLYSNTKSAEYRAWINGVDQNELYSDFNTFNAWVWKTLGISKEDFFSFYLITSDEYKPFLSVGDTAKKEIINRFSGADKVDLVFPVIQTDSDAAGCSVLFEEKRLLANTTKQELLVSQLNEAELEISEEKRNEVINSKEIEMVALLEEQNEKDNGVTLSKYALQQVKNDVEAFNEKTEGILQPFKDEVELAELEVEAFEFTKDYDKEFADLTDVKDNLEADVFEKKQALVKVKDQFTEIIQRIKDEETKITAEVKEQQTQLPLVRNKFTKELLEISIREQGIKESITEAEVDMKKEEEFESLVSKQLHDTITCPKCSHKFSLRDKAFNYEEAVKELPNVQQRIKEYKELITECKNMIAVDFKAEYDAVNQKIIDAEGEIKKELERLNTCLVDVDNNKSDINNEILKAGEGIRSQLETLNAQLVAVGQNVSLLRKEQQVELNGKHELENKIIVAKRNLTNKQSEVDQDLTVLKNSLRRCELNLTSKENELKAHIELIVTLENSINKLKSEDADRSKVIKINSDIDKLKEEEVAIAEKLESYRKRKEGIDAWDLNFKSFKSHLANKSIKNIEDYTNLFLQNMGSNLQINIDGYKTLASKKIREQITTSVLRDGFDAGSYGKFSGGERGRISISVILSIQELINLNSKFGGIDFLCCDEILDQVDVTGLESIVSSIQSLGKTIMIVSQNDIASLPEFTITIQKQNRISTILN